MGGIIGAFAGTLLTWGLTAAGAALVFVFPSDPAKAELQQKLLDGSLGFSAGVMLAASFFSLLAPAVEMAAEDYGESLAFIPATVGFLLGAAFVYAGDAYVGADNIAAYLNVADPAAQSKKSDDPIRRDCRGGDDEAPGTPGSRTGPATPRRRRKNASDSSTIDSPTVRSSAPHLVPSPSVAARKATLRRVMLLVFAVTVHNFPEGAAVGVAFGAVGTSASATTAAAWTLALGIGIQNMPEGACVSVPLHRAGMSKGRAFFLGQLSGMVEPIAGVLGAAFVGIFTTILPYSLGFAAGAMIYVVVDSLIPEAHSSKNALLASWGAMVGFVVMMALDVGLG